MFHHIGNTWSPLFITLSCVRTASLAINDKKGDLWGILHFHICFQGHLVPCWFAWSINLLALLTLNTPRSCPVHHSSSSHLQSSEGVHGVEKISKSHDLPVIQLPSESEFAGIDLIYWSQFSCYIEGLVCYEEISMRGLVVQLRCFPLLDNRARASLCLPQLILLVFYHSV